MLLNQKFALCHSFYLEGFCVYSLKVLTIYIDRPNRQTLTAAIALASIVLVLGVSLGTYRVYFFKNDFLIHAHLVLIILIPGWTLRF